jgi:hypothetical protein
MNREQARKELREVFADSGSGYDPDQLLRDAGYVRVEDLAANTDVAKALGIARQTVNMRSQRRTPGWPGPIAHLSCGMIYDLSALPRGPIGHPFGGALKRSRTS